MRSDDITGMALALGLPSALAAHPGIKQLVREAVANEREACAKRASIALLGTLQSTSDRVLKAIRSGGQQ